MAPLAPRLEAYRSLDGGRYVFMDLAAHRRGYYVSYGRLRAMPRDDAAALARDHVLGSFEEFSSRIGGSARRRLRLGPGEPGSFGYHVSVRLASPSLLELTPYRTQGIQRRMDDQTLVVELPVPPEEFFGKLEAAFALAAATAG